MGLGIKLNKYVFMLIVLMWLRKSVEIEDVFISVFVEFMLRGLLLFEGENLFGIDNNSMYEEFEKFFDIYLKRKFFCWFELKKDVRYEKKWLFVVLNSLI